MIKAMINFESMIGGYRRFHDTSWSDQRSRWAELAEGQSPQIMVIACSDSRVDPATIFDTSPGEIFVVRNVANLVPPFELGKGRHGVSAALEFAVTQLEVAEIVVMGHGQCGGCYAALTQSFQDAKPGEGGFIARWIAMLEGERNEIVAHHGHDHGPEARRAMELAAVRVSLTNLRTFSCIREREAEGRLRLHGAFFAIDDGVLHLLDEASGEFRPV
jgi:carbonic anhydrase